MTNRLSIVMKAVVGIICGVSAVLVFAQAGPARTGLKVNLPNGFPAVRVNDLSLASTAGPVSWSRTWDGKEWKFNPHWESLSQSWTNLTGAATATTGVGTVESGSGSGSGSVTAPLMSSDASAGCWVMVDEDWQPSTGTVLIDNRPPSPLMQAERTVPFNKLMGEDEGLDYPPPRLVNIDYASLCGGGAAINSAVRDLEAVRINNDLYLGEAGRYAYSNRSVLEKRAVRRLPLASAATLETQLANGSIALAPATVAKGFRWMDKTGDWIDYNTQGQVVAYGDRNDNIIWLVRDSGGTLRGVVDAHGRVLFTLHYTGKLISEVRDYPLAGQPLDLPARSVKYEYDAANRLRAVVDVRGYKTRYDYDAGNNLTSVTDQEDRITKLAYVGSTLQQITAADGGVTDYVFDFDDVNKQFNSRVTGPQTAAGRSVEDLTHNRSGKLVRRSVNGRVEEEIRYDTGMRAEKRTDARGFSTNVVFNEFEQVVEEKREDGTTVLNAYSAVNLALTETTDAKGTKTAYQHDTKGNVIRMTEAVGTPAQRITIFEPNSQGRITKATVKGRVEANGTTTSDAVTLYDYDTQGGLSKVTDPELREQLFEHDRMGNVVSITDGLKNKTVIQWNPAGDVVKVKNALNHIWLYEYDKVGNRTVLTDPNSHVTRQVFNAMNQRIEQDIATKFKSSVKYNTQGMPILATDGDGRKLTFEYDIFNRGSKLIDGAGNEIVFSYQIPDGTGSGLLGSLNGPTEIQYPLSRQRLRYDERNRPVSWSLLDGEHVRRNSVMYDANGAAKKTTDGYGKYSEIVFDALGSMTTQIDRLGKETELVYDVRGNLLRQTDARGNATHFQRDRNGRVIKETLPLGQFTVKKYDAAGNLEQVTDALGNRTELTYDEAKRLKQSIFYNATNALQRTATFGWDKTRHLTSWTVTEDGSVAHGILSYDGAGRRTGETVTYPGGFQMTYEYTYSLGNKLSKIKWPDGTEIDYGYSKHGELDNVVIPGEGSISVSKFKWTLPESTTLPGGSVQEREYDISSSLKKLKVHTPDQKVLLDFNLRYGAENEPKSGTRYDVNSSSVAFDYSYDDEQRLTRVTSSVGGSVSDTESFTLDEVDNRTAHSRTNGTWIYDANNRLKQAGSGASAIRYEYDDAGNLIRKTEPGPVVTNFGYNAENRLVSVHDGAQRLISRYGYDALGRRMWKDQYREKSGSALAQAVRTYFLYSNDGLIAEAKQAITLNSDKTVAVDGVPDITTQLGPRPGAVFMSNVLFTKTKNSNGEPIFAYFHNDARGAPIQATDRSNNVVWAAKYNAFGHAEIITQAPTTMLPTIAVWLRLPGQLEDPETGLHHNYFRDYDPQIGRYVQKDPIGLDGGINLYAYVGGNPLRFIDPFGLKPWDYNGRGNTKICNYYKKRAGETCGKLRDYYVAGEQICRGNRPDVNIVMDAGISTAWGRGTTNQSQADIYNQVRGGLIQNDTAFVNQFGPNGVTGNMIDFYHDQVFNEAGIGASFYGGNLWPQGVWPNPVPLDGDGKSGLDPRRLFPSGTSDGCACKAN